MFNILLPKDISEEPLWKELTKQRIESKITNQKHWLQNCLFSPVWWLMIATFILLWFVWWKLVDKARLLEIVAYGLIITIISSIFDIIAAQFILWGYPNKIVPLTPPLLFADFSVLPVIYMLIYQYFTSWKAFFIGVVILACLIAFVLEPIAIRLDILQFHNWKYIYSFLVAIVNGLFAKWIMNSIMEKQEKSN